MVLLDAIFIYEKEYCKPEVIAATEKVKLRIIHTPPWKEQIKQKAKQKNISFEEMLELDAKFIYESGKAANPKSEKKEMSLNEAKEMIKKNAQWAKDLTVKAKEKGISVDSMLTIDALWYIENEKNKK
jgi:hypothetical protein